MRIAIVAPLVTAIREPQLGGSQAIVADLATGLHARGHEVHVYAASGSEIPGVTIVDSGVDASSLAGLLYRHGRSPAADARAADHAFATVYASIRRGSYDVVHNHAFDPPAIRLASSLLAPVVHTLHLPPDPVMASALAESRGSENPPIIATVSASAAIMPNGSSHFAGQRTALASAIRCHNSDRISPPWMDTPASPLCEKTWASA